MYLLVLQNNYSHSNFDKVKCKKKQIFPSVRFETTTFCICSERLIARPREPHARQRIHRS